VKSDVKRSFDSTSIRARRHIGQERERERARCSGCGGQSESIGQFHGDSSPTTEQPVTADRDWIFAPFPGHLRLYDTIRDAILTCARKPTRVRLIYRTEPTTKKCKNRKTKKSRKQICSESEITVNSLGNPCSES